MGKEKSGKIHDNQDPVLEKIPTNGESSMLKNAHGGSETKTTQTLKGMDPKMYEKECEFFLQKGWEMIPSSISRIEDTAKTIMGSSAILSGIYFAAMKISSIGFLSNVGNITKFLFLSPIFLWLIAFLFSFFSFSRRGINLDLNVEAETIREIFLRVSKRKAIYLKISSYALFISIGLLLINLYILFSSS